MKVGVYVVVNLTAPMEVDIDDEGRVEVGGPDIRMFNPCFVQMPPGLQLQADHQNFCSLAAIEVVLRRALELIGKEVRKDAEPVPHLPKPEGLQ